MATEQIDAEAKRKIIGILSVLFPEAKIYLFGSRAWGNARPFSDIDVAIDEGKRIDILRMSEAHGMFDSSNFPMKIDIVDLRVLPVDWIELIEKKGIAWKS